MSLKEGWWCVKDECKHYNVHTVHKGSVVEIEGCKHKSAINSKKCTTPNIGLPLKEMVMCPVLYDMED